jgi:HEAT repeat protein
VRQAAIAAINSLGHPEMAGRAVKLLTDPDPRVRESAVKIAGYFGYGECVELLLERCRDEEESVRRAAIESIAYTEDERVASVLADALKNETPRMRASAAQAFAQVEGDGALPHLMAALEDPDQWVRYFAARSIGQHRYAESLDALARLAQTDRAGHVRIAALESLGQIGGARAVEILTPLSEAADIEIACAAINGLGMMSHPDALPPLLSALRSPDSYRRITALAALGKRGGPGAAQTIQWVAAADPDPEVAQAAIDALARLATPEAIATLVELTADGRLREPSIDALARLGKEHIQAIGQGLAHAQARVRRALGEALGRMKQALASELLNAALDDEDAAVRLAAVNALVHMSNRGAERKLVTLARADSDPAVRRAAQRALRR